MVLYNIGIHLYTAAIKLASLWNGKARSWRTGRRDIFSRMKERIGADGSDRPLIWIHAASLGEFEQGRPVIEAIRSAHPRYRILLTFFSPSGYEIRRDYPGADYIFYLPADTPRNVRRFLDIARPSTAVFIKYEFWLNYLSELRRRVCLRVPHGKEDEWNFLYRKANVENVEYKEDCVEIVAVADRESRGRLSQYIVEESL